MPSLTAAGDEPVPLTKIKEEQYRATPARGTVGCLFRRSGVGRSGFVSVGAGARWGRQAAHGGADGPLLAPPSLLVGWLPDYAGFSVLGFQHARIIHYTRKNGVLATVQV